MAGHHKWSTIRSEGPQPGPEDIAERNRQIAELEAEQERYARTLAQLRKARELTQVEVARRMETTQGEISKLERRADAYLSTLQEYVEALGGRLRLVAEFSDGECEIQLSALTPMDEPVSPAEMPAGAAA